MDALRRTRRALLTLALMVLAVGCGTSGDVNTGLSTAATPTGDTSGSVSSPDSAETAQPVDPASAADALAALEAARQRWVTAGLDDYTFVIEDACDGCGPEERAERRVVTWSGQTYASGGSALTVDDVFVRIETAIAQGHDVAASYDEETGHPSEVRIDPTPAADDGGTRLIIRDVRAGVPGEEFSSTSFEEAARRWQATRPDAYAYVLTVACGGCHFEGRLHVKVVGDVVVEERFDSSGDGGSPVGLTIDEVFGDLSDLFGSDGGLVEGGVLINGTAEYDPAYGYPNWIGLDLEIVERQEWNRDLPPRLVFMIGRFTPLAMDDYCAAVDSLFSANTVDRSGTEYARQLQHAASLAPSDHVRFWALLQTLVTEPFDYENFNPAADALDETADSLRETCPALGIFVMNDDGFVTYLE